MGPVVRLFIVRGEERVVRAVPARETAGKRGYVKECV